MSEESESDPDDPTHTPLEMLQKHGELGALLGLLKLLLGLAELGQVEGGNLLSLLVLQLVGELGHAVLVLLVLTTGKGELLGLALSSLEGLGCLTSAGLGGSCRWRGQRHAPAQHGAHQPAW